MPHFKITIAYDGTDYVGWQRQVAGVSIQGAVEDALRQFDDRDVLVAGAGRTDAGVHATGQVASFSLDRAIDAATVVRALNAKLPADIRVMSAVEARDGFHARFDARSKTYRYRIWNGEVLPPFERRYVWHVPGPLDREAMSAAAQLINGKHDFAAFQGAGSDAATTERTIFQSAIRIPQSGMPHMIYFDICGDGFLRHMVRAIVGSLVDVGRGRHAPDWIAQVIASRDRAAAGRSAPASGLFLMSVEY